MLSVVRKLLIRTQESILLRKMNKSAGGKNNYVEMYQLLPCRTQR